jgi:drug/metabolite transporter (DMT)-like permease
VKNEYKGIASLLACTLIYSFFGILTRTLGFAIPVFYAMFTRGVVSSGILLAIALSTRQWHRIAKKDWIWFILRSVAGMVGFYGSYVAFYFIPLGTAYFIFYAGVTIGGYALGKILFGERITRVKVLSLILALIGLLLIYSFNPLSGAIGYMLLSLVAGFGTAVWGVFSKKISGQYADIQLNAIDFIFTVIISFVLSILFRESWVPIAVNTVWIANALFIVMFLSVGQLMVYGFRRVSAQIGSLVMLMEVVFGVIWGWLIYKETMSLFTVLGGMLILSAIILPEIRQKKLKI